MMADRIEVPGLGAIELGEYRATYEPVHIGSVMGVRHERHWVIRRGLHFVGLADTPRQVQEIVQWAKDHRRAAA